MRVNREEAQGKFPQTDRNDDDDDSERVPHKHTHTIYRRALAQKDAFSIYNVARLAQHNHRMGKRVACKFVRYAQHCIQRC